MTKKEKLTWVIKKTAFEQAGIQLNETDVNDCLDWLKEHKEFYDDGSSNAELVKEYFTES